MWKALLLQLASTLPQLATSAGPCDTCTIVFEQPTGSYGIGTATFDSIDEARAELFSDESSRRELVLQLWYPAAASPAAKRAPYIADAAVRRAGACAHAKPGQPVDVIAGGRRRQSSCCGVGAARA